jgi:ribulose 1,5-bisphosphate carboxylase large subunit-like protein
MMDYAKAAIDSGANCLMFSPYYAGGFQILGEIVETFDVPVYSHTAGMNMFTGSFNWGFSPTIMYQLAASYGAAFMQLTATDGYLRPFDIEKPDILKCLREEKLIGKNGMTLAIAGGLGPTNIGANMKIFGTEGLMFLAGTSVYSHPDGASAGVKSIILAHRAYQENGITDVNGLIDFGKSLGKEGEPLVHAKY